MTDLHLAWTTEGLILGMLLLWVGFALRKERKDERKTKDSYRNGT